MNMSYVLCQNERSRELKASHLCGSKIRERVFNTSERYARRWSAGIRWQNWAARPLAKRRQVSRGFDQRS